MPVTDFTELPASPTPEPQRSSPWRQLLDRHQWLAFVLPFAVYILLGTLEPSADARRSDVPEPGNGSAATASPAETTAGAGSVSGTPEAGAPSPVDLRYPLAYGLRIAATTCCVWLVWPVWKQAPRRLEVGSSVAVGAIGVVLWVAICQLRIEQWILGLAGVEHWISSGGRVAFDPHATLAGAPGLLVLFLVLRLLGMALIVPLMEEFFLRGFVMRFVEQADWWRIPWGAVGWKGAVAVTLCAVLSHPPTEAVAAAVWFSLVTWLYWRTQSIWNCVLAHAVTNALLGAYVLIWKDWTLW